MSWRLKLSDWLSGGLLKKYQREAESTKAKLKNVQINLDNLKKQLEYSKREEEQAKAQLLISRGFQLELGETQLKLKDTKNNLLQCQQKLKQISISPASGEDWYQQLQTTIDVLEVKRLPQEDFDSLWGFTIASPKAETKIPGGSIIVKGWVLGKKALATSIKINHQGKTLVETPVNLSSPGVTQYYPDIASAGKSGFETSLSIVGIPTETELEIKVLLDNQDIINLSTISLKR